MLNKTVKILFSLFFIFSGVVFSYASDTIRPRGKEQGLMLDIKDFELGTLNNVEDKKQYLSTIQLEKQRIQNFTLRMVYEEAYLLYKKGDYQRAQEIVASVLSIDPDFREAKVLSEQARRMGASGPLTEAEIIEAKMAEGKRLHQMGRLIESSKKFEEILIIQPRNKDAITWLKKTEKEIAEEHERRGDKAFDSGDYSKALDQWYSALLLRKHDPGVMDKIARTEQQYREAQLKTAMKEGFDNYSNGKLVASYNSFQKALKIQPTDPSAQRYTAQVKGELAEGYVLSGNRAYNARKYDNAIKNYQEAKVWGYSPSEADRLIAAARRAKEAPPPPKPTIKPAGGDTPSGGTAGGASGSSGGATTEPPVGDNPKAPSFDTNMPTTTEGVVSEENRRLAELRYISGLNAYNNDDYETARREWLMAQRLDPGNSDASAGLKKVDEMLGVR